MILTLPTAYKPPIPTKDSLFSRLFRGLIPYTAANSLHILLACAFQVSQLDFESSLDWYFTSTLCFLIAQGLGHPLSVLAARVQYAPYYPT